MAEIEVHYPDGLVGTKKLSRAKDFVIGSGATADLRIEEPGIRSRHCVIRWDSRGLNLEASNAQNVELNGTVVQKARLNDNDELAIESYRFVIHHNEAVASAVSPDAYYTPMWRSKIFLGVVGGFLLVCVSFLVMWFMYHERRSENLFDAAQSEFNAGSYSKAIEAFDAYLKEFPKTELSEHAVIYRAESGIRQYASGAAHGWETALDNTKQFIEDHRKLRFYETRAPEIASLIGDIAIGLATDARDSKKKEFLDKAREAIGLVERNFDRDKRPADKIEQANTLIAEAEFAIKKNEVQLAAVQRMDEALKSGRPMDVYNEHRKLYQQYSDLRENKAIADRREKARLLEKEQVRYEPSRPAPAQTPPQVPSASGWTLIRRQSAENVQPSNRPVVLTLADTVYAVDSGSGQVLWRRALGYEPAFPPTYLPDDRSKVLVHATMDNSVALLETATGKEIWRHPLAPMLLRWQTRPTIQNSRSAAGNG